MKISAEIESHVARLGLQTMTLGFSGGKDSVCSYVAMSELGIKIIPIFFYVCPGLAFVETTLKMYEDLFGVEIIRVPHPMLYDFLRHQDFMPPTMIEDMADYDIPTMTFHDLNRICLEHIGINEELYDVAGVRAAESMNRRKMFQRLAGGYDEENKKIYPIYDWKKSDVIEYLSARKISLSEDYKIWNRSYDGMKYQFLIGVKNHYPKDFEKIKEFFPLLDIEIERYELNKKYFS